MKPYAVITGYDAVNEVVILTVVNEIGGTTAGMEIDFEVVKSMPVPLSKFRLATVNMIPLNYELSSNGELLETCGSLNRLANKGTGVVLAEVVSKGGRGLGYKVLIDGKIVNLQKDKIVQLAELKENPPLHNAIVRGGTVNCYPNKPFNKIVMRSTTKTRSEKRQSNTEIHHKVSGNTEVQPKKRPIFGEAEQSELKKLQAKGYDTSFIKNPDLNAEQIRVLAISKKKGAFAECFADPRLSSDAMIFYADRIHSEEMAEDLKVLLERPDLPVDNVTELYRCICDGIEVDDLLDKSPEDIYIQRNKRQELIWSPIVRDMWFDDLLSKAKFSAKVLKDEEASSEGVLDPIFDSK